ncbi:MAG: Mov34/MPN/PAD-1 family protein [Nitrosarchaeum sp.]|nr:Mov34/MPN/PAD-1 family protein [Nitrosarchaeum sp.]
MQKITISESQKKILSNHADNEKPNESCAILFGAVNDQKTIVKEIFLTKNIDESPVNFTISNEQLIKCYKTAEEKKMEVVGIFHSHPNSEAYPSSTDKKFMYSNPVVWVIYSGISNEFKAYVLESNVLEILIET